MDWLPHSGTASAAEGLDGGTLASPRAREMLVGLKRYFATGEPLEDLLGGVSSLEAQLEGASWTEFERLVYRAVMRIPHGETRTYSWVATRIGRGGATRAVGQALRRNRHLILVPCHRVVGAQDVGGFMGSDDLAAPEVQFKQRLLAWEHSWRNPRFSFLSA